MEQHEVSQVRIRRTQQQIDDLISAFQEEGCGVREFCQKRGLNPGNFHKWLSRRKMVGSEKVTTPGFSEIVVQPSLPGHLFAQVGVIRLYQAVSAAYLKELVR